MTKGELIKERQKFGPSSKVVRVKIFTPGNKKHKVYIFRAPAGRTFVEDGIDDIVEKCAAEVEKMYPEHEYGLVKVGKADFNFVHRGHKPVDEQDIIVAGLRLGEVVTVELGS
jgi:hypothetical protein